MTVIREEIKTKRSIGEEESKGRIKTHRTAGPKDVSGGSGKLNKWKRGFEIFTFSVCTIQMNIDPHCNVEEEDKEKVFPAPKTLQNIWN